MKGRSLAVLMWKHLMVRKRRYIHTAVELISPILFILLLFSLRNSIKPVPRHRTNSFDSMVHMTEEKYLDDAHHVPSPRFLLYTPDTKLAGELMKDIGTKLGLTRLTSLPNKTTDWNYKGYYPFSSLSEIASFFGDFYTNEAVIIFDDMEGQDWSDRKTDKLAYTIRMKKRYETRTFRSYDEVPGAHKGFGDDYDQFMLLQWAIDTSYIHVRTGETVPQNLSLQEFPYYRSERTGAVILICTVLPEICWMSLTIFFVFLMSRLLEERTTGIQELIKMVGVSINTLGISHFLNVVPTGLVYSIVTTVLLKVTDNALIEHSSGVIIFLTTAIHFVSVVSMAMACSYLASNTQYTTTISIFVYIILWVPCRILISYTPPHAVVLFTGLLPHVPLHWLWTEVQAYEQYNRGLTFANITSSHTSSSGPVLLGLVCLVLQSAIFFFLAWYLSHVRPGNYGQAMPWNFFCQRQYWTQNEIKPIVESEFDEEEHFAKDMKYFEETPKHLDVGIKIENVSKVFPKHKALSNVTLDVYKGEITVLLGHNGAGKTTLMSIITGMISATEGKVFVNGLDSVSQRAAVRQQLGLCPQHNLFFPDLTVIEHAVFFSLLKGGTYKSASESSMVLLNSLGISSKANNKSSELSGGMKRRLQLACALAGGADVLILDEPTSGLDVQTRRELWDLLLSLRGSRTVLLTTHFMEEADALGDRVAALHLGRLRCHASPMHLKKAIGTGYRLTLTTNGVPRDSPITDVVTSFVHDATVKDKTVNSLSYNLPATGSSKFPNLFTTLEEKKSELGIETIGVGVSTLEEVFLKLCSDTDTTFIEDEVDMARPAPTYNKVTGVALYWRQFCVLFKRQLKYIRSKSLSFLIMQAMLPILMIFVFTFVFNNSEGYTKTQPEITLDLDLYKPMLERKVLYHIPAEGASLRASDSLYQKVVFTDSTNITDTVLRAGNQSTLEYNKYLVGIELDDTHAKALYTTVYRHAAPVALNLLSNTIASQYFPDIEGRAITTRNHPIDEASHFDDPLKTPKKLDSCFGWAVLVVIIILSTNINLSSLPCRERVSGSRHIHIMSGCPAALYWATTLVSHCAVCVLLLVVPTAVAAATVDTDHTLTQPDMILTLMLVLIVGSLAFFAFMYIVSFYFAERTTSIVVVAFMVLFGVVTTSIQSAVGYLTDGVNPYLGFFLAVALYTMPPHALTIAAAKCVYVARINAYCVLNKDRCPNLIVADEGFDTKKCCAGENSLNYFAISNYSPGKEMICLAAQFIVYMTLVVLTQKGFFNSLCDHIFNLKLKNRATPPGADDIVRAEAVYVNKEIALPKKQIADAKLEMLVNDVHKNYYRLIGKSCYAVKGLSFSVKKGECFGLLGVNGAGKSTTFKMLTAEECTTKGEVYANGHFIKKDKDKYLRSLGYCPQFFGLDDFQTGYDNLQLLLTLRGLDAQEVRSEVKSWINTVGLAKYSGRVVSGYSGGCVRRLGAAGALCCGAALTLLDEPTAGVDPAARRRLWACLRRALAARRSVLITSHSMDEMEALCDRIGIMSGGELRALGTPAELRARHAQGHAVLLKLAHVDEVDGAGASAAKSSVDSLKNSLHSKFNCTLKDEHKTMLHYHINESMRYSELFARLESLRGSFPALLEDYSVCETTLEEVFLSFARGHEAQSNGIV